MAAESSPSRPCALDVLTVIALSSLAYIVATAVHEHLGHGLTCLSFGAPLREVGAFYVDCDSSKLADWQMRMVALAGPLASLLLGLLCWAILPRRRRGLSHPQYFVWLLGTLGLMAATGYLLFSGVSGIGDFGFTRDGVFYGAQPEWVWRAGLAVVGLGGYVLVVLLALRALDRVLGGAGPQRVACAQRLAVISYLTGAVVCVAVGALNPHGILIVLTSAAASSLGATFALVWMMQLLDRKEQRPDPILCLGRSWAWVAAGAVATLLYAVILGPTIRP